MRKRVRKCMFGFSRYRDNQCRESRAGENKLRWHRGKSALITRAYVRAIRAGFCYENKNVALFINSHSYGGAPDAWNWPV